jgi:mono/diheme cytochrome c family protein
MRRLGSSLLALALACLAAVGAIRGATSQVQPSTGKPAPQSPPLVMPVEGPSNFHRLGLAFESSSMGRTGLWGTRPESYQGPPVHFVVPEGMTRAVVLTGADLYRLQCRPCHKADGNGAPPEIPAISGPVQATSATMMERRMRERGRPISAAFAQELASGSQKDLLARLKNGGQKMPSFSYLTDSEIRALIGYLDVLAGVPVTGKTATVTQPAARVGELLVKGTCHICHDATGTWPDPEELLQGSIPPIAGFTTKRTMPEFIWKVRHGAPVVMGFLQLTYRGRMPVFDYLSDDEVASAYLNLIHYPPQNGDGASKMTLPHPSGPPR